MNGFGYPENGYIADEWLTAYEVQMSHRPEREGGAWTKDADSQHGAGGHRGTAGGPESTPLTSLGLDQDALLYLLALKLREAKANLALCRSLMERVQW